MVQDILWASLHYVLEPVFKRWPAKRLREKALDTVMQHIHYEDENTRYICIGPVNKVCEDILIMHIITFDHLFYVSYLYVDVDCKV